MSQVKRLPSKWISGKVPIFAERRQYIRVTFNKPLQVPGNSQFNQERPTNLRATSPDFDRLSRGDRTRVSVAYICQRDTGS